MATDPQLEALQRIASRHREIHLQRTSDGWVMLNYVKNGKTRELDIPTSDGTATVELPDFDVIGHAKAQTIQELDTTLSASDDLEDRL